jgi:hypothetical protein
MNSAGKGLAKNTYWQPVDKARQQRSRITQRLNVRQRVRFASSFAAALLDGLSEQPAGHSASAGDLEHCAFSAS